MYSRRTQKWISRVSVFLGILGLILRLALDRFFRDANGLVPALHPLSLAAGVLAAVALVLALLAARTIEDVEGYLTSFPASFPAFLGHLLAAGGILATVLTALPGIAGLLALIWKGLAYLSVPCLLVAGFLRLRGKQPFFLLHLVPALFVLIHAVSNYRLFSSEPQAVNYLFALLGILSILFFTFFHSAFDVGLEWRRKLTFCAYASLSLGLAAIPASPYPWLYLGFALWAVLDRPVPRVRRRRPRPFAEETAQ